MDQCILTQQQINSLSKSEIIQVSYKVLCEYGGIIESMIELVPPPCRQEIKITSV